MSLIPIDRDPQPRQLLVFGTLWLLVFGAFGVAGVHRSGGWEAVTEGNGAAVAWAIVVAVAVAVPAIGLLWREVLRRAYVALTVLTWPLGWVISRVLLAVAYYLVLTPVGLALRLTGRDSMDRRLDKTAESYWKPRSRVNDPRRYFRQF